MNSILPYNNRIAAHARNFAHNASYGKCDQLVICPVALTRHLLAVALIEWCSDQGWICNEIDPCTFHLRSCRVIIRHSVSESTEFTDVTYIEK